MPGANPAGTARGLLVQSHELAIERPMEMRCHMPAAAPPQRGPVFRAPQQIAKAPGQRGDIALWDQKAGLTGDDALAEPVMVGRQHRQPGRLRLQQRQPLAFLVAIGRRHAGEDKEVRAAQEWRTVSLSAAP